MRKRALRTAAALLVFLLVFSLMPKGVVNAGGTLLNEIRVYNYLVGKMGLNTAAACGLLANVEAESGFNPGEDGDQGTSYGLFQWHAGRKTNLINYCKEHKLDYTTIKGQLAFLEYELKQSYPSVLSYIQSVKNTAQGAYDAGYHWCYYYERPRDKETKSDRRGSNAKSVYWEKYKGFGGKTYGSTDGRLDPADYKVAYSRALKVEGSQLTGFDVLYIQVCLSCLGYDIVVDGVYGRGSEAVIKQFQTDQGLEVDGACGPITWKALESAIAKNPSLKIVAQPQNVAGDVGEKVSFSVRARGIALSYQWYYKKTGADDWTLWKGHTTASTSGTVGSSWDGMQVKCRVTDAKGNTADSKAATVSLTSVLAITEQPKSVTASAGDSVTFSVKASGKDLRYQWYFKKSGASDWTLWNGHTTASTAATVNDGWDGMKVMCKVTDGSGSTLNSNAATVTMVIPFAITQQPQDVTADAGDNVTFRVNATGKSLSYQWYVKKSGASDWTAWKGHTTASTSAVAGESWDGMQVRCEVTDSSGSTLRSNAVTVTMRIPLAIVSHPEDVEPGIGETVTFRVKATGRSLSYQWYVKKSGASDWTAWKGHIAASTSAVANESWDGMQVMCRVTDADGKSLDSQTAAVSMVIPFEITQQPQNVATHVGDTVTFAIKASGRGLGYQWYIKKADAADWTEWKGHTAASVAAVANESWNGMKVRCKVTEAGGNSMMSGEAWVSVRIAVTGQSRDVTAKSGDSVTFSVRASGSGLRYQWYFRKAGAEGWTLWNGHTGASTSAVANESWDGMKVMCRITDSAGKTADSAAATVTMNIPFEITRQPQNATAKIGESVAFAVEANGVGLQYQWYVRKAGAADWTLWKGHTTARTSAFANESWDGMKVKCRVTDGRGRTLDSDASVVTLDIPLVITRHPEPVAATVGENTKFSVKASGKGLHYQWYFRKAGAASWIKWEKHTTATTYAVANGTWDGMKVMCIVRDADGNSTNSNAAVVTLPLKITEQPRSLTAESGETVKFVVRASGSGLQYQWYVRKSGASDWTLWKGHTTAVTSAVANDTWDEMLVRCRVTDGKGNILDSGSAAVTIDKAEAVG